MTCQGNRGAVTKNMNARVQTAHTRMLDWATSPCRYRTWASAHIAATGSFSQTDPREFKTQGGVNILLDRCRIAWGTAGEVFSLPFSSGGRLHWVHHQHRSM